MNSVKPDPIIDGNALELSQQMLFASQGKYLLTQGVFECFELCSSDYEPGTGKMSDFLQQKLAAAKQAGIENPIVVGAFPFDHKQKGQLLIPQSWQFHSVEQIQSMLDLDSKMQPSAKSSEHIPSAQGYKDSVIKAKDKFEQGSLNKVVLSKCLDITTRSSISKTVIMDQLINNNTRGYHFSVPLDKERVLMGVSPELLLRKVGLAIESNPLAGSRKRDQDPGIDKLRQEDLLNSAKDKVEHSYVTDSIKQQLSPLCSSLMVPETPALLSTKTMWHLSSHIDGVLANDNLSAAEIACLLHPTPAVGGSPDKAAKSAINELECFDREFFAGTLGWMDSQGDGEWVVSIRCAMVTDTKARLYAGAGVVIESTPEDELMEVNAKLKTMKDVFGFSDMQSANLDPGEVCVN